MPMSDLLSKSSSGTVYQTADFDKWCVYKLFDKEKKYLFDKNYLVLCHEITKKKN